MDHDQALKLLKGGKAGIEEWNAWVATRSPEEAKAAIAVWDLGGADLTGADLTGADLRSAKLYGVRFSGAALKGANLRGAETLDADLSFVDLSGADLSGATLCSANFRDAELDGANFSGADLRYAKLSYEEPYSGVMGAQLMNARLGHANLGYADLRGADLRDADLSGANLTCAKLSDANLSGASVADAELSDVDLHGADLTGAHLRGANLTRAKLSDADLTGADLSGADLSGADIRGATLMSVQLDGADLSNAAVDSNVDLVTHARWAELKIDSKNYRRERLHIAPLPFGMGPCLTLSLQFGALSDANWKLLCGIADSMTAGGNFSIVVHQGGADYFEVRSYGTDREVRLLQTLETHASELARFAAIIESLAWPGLSKADWPGLLARLRSAFEIHVSEQDERALQAMKDGPERKALARARDTSVAALIRKLLAALGG